MCFLCPQFKNSVFVSCVLNCEVYYHITGTNYDSLQNKTEITNIMVFWDVTSCCLMKTRISIVETPVACTFTVTPVWNIMPPHTRTSQSSHSSLWELQSSNAKHETHFTWKSEEPHSERIHHSNKSQGHAHWKMESFVAFPWLLQQFPVHFSGTLDKCTGNQETTITLFPQMVYLTNPMADTCCDSVVGTATGYGLDSPGIESQSGWDFLDLSRLALGSTEPPVQWIEGLLQGVKRLACNADHSYNSTAALGIHGLFYGELYCSLDCMSDGSETFSQNKQAVVRQQYTAGYIWKRSLTRISGEIKVN